MNAAITDLDAATLAQMALAVHLKTCGSCRNEYCEAGRRYHDATRPDLSWIPDTDRNET